MSSAPPDETHTSTEVTQEKKKENKKEHALWDPSNLDASKNPFACGRAESLQYIATHCSLRHGLHQIVYWEYTQREPTSIQAFFERGEQARDQDELNKTPSNSYDEQLDLEHFSSNSQVEHLL